MQVSARFCNHCSQPTDNVVFFTDHAMYFECFERKLQKSFTHKMRWFAEIVVIFSLACDWKNSNYKTCLNLASSPCSCEVLHSRRWCLHWNVSQGFQRTPLHSESFRAKQNPELRLGRVCEEPPPLQALAPTDGSSKTTHHIKGWRYFWRHTFAYFVAFNSTLPCSTYYKPVESSLRPGIIRKCWKPLPVAYIPTLHGPDPHRVTTN